MSELLSACQEANDALNELLGATEMLMRYPDAYAERPDGWRGWDDEALANITGNDAWRGLKSRLETALAGALDH